MIEKSVLFKEIPTAHDICNIISTVRGTFEIGSQIEFADELTEEVQKELKEIITRQIEDRILVSSR